MAADKALVKVVILGDAGVGKTSLMQRYVNGKYTSSYKATIGADFTTLDVPVGDSMVTVQVWDTAGQERFQSLGKVFYRGADACVLVYDLQSVPSFEKLDALQRDFMKETDTTDPSFPFVVLGNKADVDPSRQAVLQSAVKQWCDAKGGIPHFLVRFVLPLALVAVFDNLPLLHWV